MEIRHLSQEMELLRKEYAEANEVLCLLVASPCHYI